MKRIQEYIVRTESKRTTQAQAEQPLVESSRVELSQGKLTSTAATAEEEKTSGAKPPFHPLRKKEEKKKLRPRPKTVLLHVVQVTRPKLLQPSRDASQ